MGIGYGVILALGETFVGVGGNVNKLLDAFGRMYIQL